MKIKYLETLIEAKQKIIKKYTNKFKEEKKYVKFQTEEDIYE